MAIKNNNYVSNAEIFDTENISFPTFVKVNIKNNNKYLKIVRN